MNMITAVLVNDDTVEVRKIGNDPDIIARIVDDVAADVVFLKDLPVAMCVAAHGKSFDSHTPNIAATGLAEVYLPGFGRYDIVHGLAVFVGVNDSGDFVDVPDSVVTVARNRHITMHRDH